MMSKVDHQGDQVAVTSRDRDTRTTHSQFLAGGAEYAHHGPMSSESRRNPLWYVLGLIVVGVVVWWVLKLLFGLLFYLIIGAVVVGALVLLTGKGPRSLRGGARRTVAPSR